MSHLEKELHADMVGNYYMKLSYIREHVNLRHCYPGERCMTKQCIF